MGVPDYNNRILGHYRLLRLLGQGGFADVYLGEHIHLKTYASIKILHSRLAEDGMKHFLAEARTLAGLKHQNIVPVLDFGMDEMTPYLVMEYASNGTLRQRHPRGVPVALNVVVSYVQQIASALQYAHNQKLIHRDVKPENMLIGDQNQILLSDFGIAILSASARATTGLDSSWISGGTAPYMAPEQIQGQPAVASDQYALAVVVYEWLTGEQPFRGSYMEILAQQMTASPPPLRGKAPSITDEVEQVVLTALQKDAQRRFGHIQAFAHALKLAARATEEPTMSDGSTKSSEALDMEAVLVGPFGRLILGSIKVTIGRSSENTIVLDDTFVSPRHAELRQEGPGYSLFDLGSVNGTFVNEQPIAHQRVLQPGDRIRIGNTQMLFEGRNAVLPSFSMPQNNMQMLPTPGQGAYAVQQPVNQPSFLERRMTSYGVAQNDAETVPPPGQGAYAVQQPANQPPFSATPASPYGSPTPQQPLPPGSVPLGTPSYTPVLSQPPQKRFPLLRVIVLVGLALLVILLGGGGTLAYRNQVALNNKNATATAQAHQQLLAQQRATGTALAQQHATATAVSQVQATATAQATSLYPPFTKLAFFDPLTSAGASWTERAGCHFSSSGLQVSVATAGLSFLCVRAGTFGEMAYQATMTITQGDCGGLLFRGVDLNNYAALLVCQDGTYNLGAVVSDKLRPLYPQPRANSVIHQGVNQQNVIAVAIQGDTITVYINGQPVDTTQQAVFTSTLSQGWVGLLAVARNGATTVNYTNAILWT